MIPKIFERVNDKIIFSDDILRIPILKNLYDTYNEEALDMLSIIDYYCDVQGIYNNYEEETKLDDIIEDLGFTNREYKLNSDFVNVLDWCKDRWLTTGEKFYLSHKTNIEKIGHWAANSMLTDGLGGNVGDRLRVAKEVRKLYQELISFENEVKTNLKGRGQSEIAYDQM